MDAAAATGWKLDRDERAALLARFPPRWPDVVADHVTLRSRHDDAREPPAARGAILGEADDGAGVQALVVAVDGSSDRPDGGTYHITWSLDRARGREAKDSNDVIARCGWRRWPDETPVTLIAARW